ncbi:MAG: hypothetical protein H6Q52_723 [Deltaproteobacteria bacterium]|nr:hypothetical protein [Deltaproteobacteria bacterium]
MLLLCAISSADSAKDKDPSGFLSATYGLIGKRPGSSETYSGAVAIKPHGNTIEVIRCVGSSRIKGKGSIISITSDKIPSLKVRWRDGKDDYEALYMIHSDSDNYARLSGPYVRLHDETKLGWELLYVDPDDAAVCK